jgi:hypothetical protein
MFSTKRPSAPRLVYMSSPIAGHEMRQPGINALITERGFEGSLAQTKAPLRKPRDEALEYLRHYNRRCQPAWSEKDLAHKIDSAIETCNRRWTSGRPMKPPGYLRCRKDRGSASMPKPSPIGKRSKLSRNGHSGAFASKKLSRMPQDRRFVAGQYCRSLLLVRCLCGMPPRVYGTRITCDIQMSLIYLAACSTLRGGCIMLG